MYTRGMECQLIRYMLGAQLDPVFILPEIHRYPLRLALGVQADLTGQLGRLEARLEALKIEVVGGESELCFTLLDTPLPGKLAGLGQIEPHLGEPPLISFSAELGKDAFKGQALLIPGTRERIPEIDLARDFTRGIRLRLEAQRDIGSRGV
ncbi:MAG TPA: hypothetical protein VE844_11840, partial [Gammaproteobacteria bacterium]|nr:hypothetical protein [Gammaproteobacteria bacterium]